MSGIQLGFTQKIAEADIVINHGRVEKSRWHDIDASLLIVGAHVEEVELPHAGLLLPRAGKRGVSLEEHLSAARELLSMAAGLLQGEITRLWEASRDERLGDNRPGQLNSIDHTISTLHNLWRRMLILPIRVPDAAIEEEKPQ